MSQPLLSVQNIKVSYGDKEVLHGVSFDVMSGEIVTLIGSNGAGKSTVLKAIYGLVPLQEGSIFFDGEAITGLETHKLLEKGIVYIGQKNNLFEGMSVRDNLEMAAYMYSKQDSKQKIETLLEKYPLLQENLDKKIDTLSGGQRQIVALGMGLIHDPKLVLFDEPSAGLDVKSTDNFIKTLSTIKNSMLIVEHRISEIQQITNFFVKLQMGQIDSSTGLNFL